MAVEPEPITFVALSNLQDKQDKVIMVNFERHKLSNGLRVLAHVDKSSPLVAFNLLYDVGARDEDPGRTGFAHLFEHLMFGGSDNVPVFDEPLEKAGAQNNAFTSNDITNYYITLPKQNLETAFWVESDRMNALRLTPGNIRIQKDVVVEEFRQRYLNQPYGDIWSLLRPLAYKVHPYRWPTIGMDISHISSATEEEIQAFFKKHYCPGNAILAVAGNISPGEVFELAEKWFGPIHNKSNYQRKLPKEPAQKEQRTLTVHRKVPAHNLSLAFHMPGRQDTAYHACDLLSDLLSNGESARLNQKMVREYRLFSEINAFITGDIDEGLLLITGKLFPEVDMEEAHRRLMKEITRLCSSTVGKQELDKVKNKTEVALNYGEMKNLEKAMNLCFFELLGNAADLSNEKLKYREVSRRQILETAQNIFRTENSSCLYYLAGRAEQ